jgi:predicted nucleotidyltransferase component of viral defense system
MQTEELLVRILNHLAERMKDRLIVKGGMLLRLLESPRYTQDLDFVLLSKESKKVLVKELISALEEIPGIEVTREDLNSRGIFIDVRDRDSGTRATLETNVVLGTRLPSEPMSTAKISSLYALSGRIIRVMAPAEAFSNKIAACLERGAGRDLYDLSLFEPMTPFDVPTLEDRLSRLEIDRAKSKKITRDEAALLLKRRLDDMSEKRLKEEIFPLIPPEHQAGLLLVIRASVSRIIQRMRA